MFGKLFTKISTFFFKDIILKFKNKFSNFNKILGAADINEDLSTYLSNIIFISFFLFVVFEFLFIYLMILLNIYFNILSFIITVFLSFTVSSMIFFLLYKYPYFIVDSKRRKIDDEIGHSIKHLAVLNDENLTVKDILIFLTSLENNKLLTEESKKILSISNLNNNLKDTLKSVVNNTYSDLEKNLFRKLIDVLDNKEKLNDVINNFLIEYDKSKKEINEQKKSRINLLFQVNIFLFFLVILFLITIFVVNLDQKTIKDLLFFVAILFPIIEFLLIIVLYKN
jgi:archaellum biogenesis protein FlaJ (TadC family)